MMNELSKKNEQIELVSLVRLYNIPRISTLRAHQLIKKFGCASAIFDSELARLNSKSVQWDLDFFSRRHLERAIEVLEQAKQFNYQVMGYGLKGYPKLLMECEDAPLVLFTSGKINWNTNRWISVVGTRKASQDALKWTRTLIEGLKDYNPTIVSGLAYGIDGAAHQAAVDCGLQTVGCLAHGLKITYPSAHITIRKAMEQQGGVLSEFMPQEKPLPYKFVQRNRIIAGLSKAVVVVESPMKGGSLITADLANSYHRDVFALPNRISDKHQGCNQLIRDAKAQLVSSSEDLAYFLGWD